LGPEALSQIPLEVLEELFVEVGETSRVRVEREGLGSCGRRIDAEHLYWLESVGVGVGQFLRDVGISRKVLASVAYTLLRLGYAIRDWEAEQEQRVVEELTK
jgi:hypothetical protein